MLGHHLTLSSVNMKDKEVHRASFKKKGFFGVKSFFYKAKMWRELFFVCLSDISYVLCMCVGRWSTQWNTACCFSIENIYNIGIWSSAEKKSIFVHQRKVFNFDLKGTVFGCVSVCMCGWVFAVGLRI